MHITYEFNMFCISLFQLKAIQLKVLAKYFVVILRLKVVYDLTKLVFNSGSGYGVDERKKK